MASAAHGELTLEQESAVARRGEPLLVSAGAGSGKTSVLVERFVRAVCEDGVAPGRILAITFTDRAAGELRERVRSRLLEMSRREAARDTEAAFVCTFHGFSTRLLRAHALQAGVDPQFQILDESLAAGVREQAFSLALAEFLQGERDDAVELVAAYGADRLRAMLWRTHAELRSRGCGSPRLPPLAPSDPHPATADVAAERGGGPGLDADAAARRACALLDELLATLGSRYEALKRSRGRLDFDDLELKALELLESNAQVRESWSERFEALMVDEFQDTNPRQLRILQALERDNLFTVGDEQQSIYGFRDADVGLFRARRAQLDVRGASLALTGNFRSQARLLEVINGAFSARLGDRFTPLTPLRAHGVSNGRARPASPAVELLLTGRNGWNGNGGGSDAASGAAQAPRWRQAEAHALAGRVHELVSARDARAGEVAVLLRALGDIEVYEGALAQRGLHTVATAGGFWRRQEVCDLLSYLRAIANPLDELSLYGALAGPLGGLSSDALALIARAAQEREQPVWATLSGDGLDRLGARLAATDGERLEAFCQRLARHRAGAGGRSASWLLQQAIADGAFERHLRALGTYERRLANVHKLLRLARAFEASEGRDVRAFVDHAALQERAGSGPEADAPVAGSEPDAVRLMSVHAAKGLEFEVVCVADLGRALNLAVPDLLVQGAQVGLRLARLDGSEPTPALAFGELCERRKLAQAQEEERILYVAMTRARERLLLSGAVSFERWPEARLGAAPIAWLAPALAPELPGLLGAGGDLPRELELPAGAPRVRLLINPAGGLEEGAWAARAQGRHSIGSAPAARAAAPSPAEDSEPARARTPSAGGEPAGTALAFAQGASLSYTALSEHRRCGYRFYLERVLGLEEDRAAARDRARGGVDPRARGVVVHRLLEALDVSSPQPPSLEQAKAAAAELGISASAGAYREMVALVSAVAGRVQAAGVGAPGPSRSAQGTPRAPAARSAGVLLGARLAGARRVHREHPFAFALGAGQPLLSGVIDVLALEADGAALVVDYKTDSVHGDEPLERVVGREYDLQRLIYALAVLRDGAARVELVHWFLERPDEPVSATFAMRDRARLEGKLAEQLRVARRRGFSVSEHPHRGLCETCPGRVALCSHDESETLRESPPDGPGEAAA